MTSGDPTTGPSAPRATAIGVAGFALMLAIGSMYALSAFQVRLPALFGIPPALTVAPFAAASLGLAAGTGLAPAVLARVGARSTAIAGTVLWGLGVAGAGLAVGGGELVPAIVAFVVGGVGVGAAYLTIIATVGPSFPARPLVGSALGPLGFACGSVAFFLSALAVGRDGVAASGPWLVTAGALIVVVALALGWGMPRAVPGDGTPPRSAPAVRRRLSTLLFVNALPGMLVLSVVVPLLAAQSGGGTDGAVVAIAATMIALFLGGLLAPTLRTLLGARGVFAALLALRGVLLVVVPFVPSLPAYVALFAVVLFGHGAGFSLLPGLVRAGLPGAFAAQYGRVLVTWGLSGVVGAGVAAASAALTGGDTAALVVVGLVALAGASVLAVVPGSVPEAAGRPVRR